MVGSGAATKFSFESKVIPLNVNENVKQRINQIILHGDRISAQFWCDWRLVNVNTWVL